MCSSPEQIFFQVNDSHEAAMKVTEDAVSRRLAASNKTYFCFTTASLTVCLVFALATIMVLIVQRKEQTISEPGRISAVTQENNLEVIFTALQHTSIKKAAAYMRVSKPVDSPKLKWIPDVVQNITNENGDLVIQIPGCYLVYCKLQFHVTNFSNNTIDLQLDLLVNNSPRSQTLNTLCPYTNRQTLSKNCGSPNSDRIYQALFTFQLFHLRANDSISVKTDQYKYLDFSFLPNDSVLAVLRYSD